MAARRLLLALLALTLCATAATSAPAAPPAPTGLHGFLFRADEPTRREFPRTPSFAWSPVPGATRYEFELSLSDTFRENGLVYAARELVTPVASVELTLPWITGQPYSLFARVRAVTKAGIGPWSAPFGFNMRQPNVPKPLPTFPGLLRWTPVEGANAYEVWLIDADKKLFVYTNVLDQREFYTFHQSDPWTSKVRWRIRAQRWDYAREGEGRQNGLPATQFGPWSPVYESTNTSFDTGPLRLVGTVSDVVARGLSTEAAHRYMPAFVFAGNKGLDGKEAELFRVYAFTDRDCINRVYTGAIVGSPAYAGRPYGSLALPRDSSGLVLARSRYLADGDAGPGFAQDGESIVPNEELPSPTPTTGLPGAAPATPAPAPSPAPSGDDTSTPAPTTPAPTSSSSQVKFLTVAGDVGAPIDLWDIDWPQGGYYWTVVPVQAVAPASIATSVATAAAIGDASLTVSSASGFSTGDVIQIGNPSNQEAATVTGVTGSVITIATPLKQGHGSGEPVVRTMGNLTYRDLELPQEVCAAGRVMRFGKSSEPTLVAAGTPFASGLSPRGLLTTATPSAASFYSSPLVAWTPALGADAYHVQWSKVRAPFAAQSVEWQGKGAAAGFLTFATSAVLPLKPGTWWYRVRGVDFNLPTNAQFLGWSEPTRLVVTKPTFTVAKPKPKKKK